MIQVHSDSDSDIDVPDAVGLLADEFLKRHRDGMQPAIEDYCARYPECAERIRNLFPMLLMVEQCGTAANNDTSQSAVVKLSTKLPGRIGDFKIVREVGRGGMGIVYEAEQQSLGRRVALKVLPTTSAMSPSRLERFRRESRAAARLHHSNIVPVFGVGEDDGLHYYVMQFIEGVGLDEILLQLAESKRSGMLHHMERQWVEGPRSEGLEDPSVVIGSPSSSSGQSSVATDRLYWRRVAMIGFQLANALHFAHTQGVLHRDVKPANVLLDSHGLIWLTDFGLAHANDEADLTCSGDIVGTLRYLAPERLRGDGSRQSDVYGLGATLYELLTLVPAFAETDRVTLIGQIAQQEPKRLRLIDPNIPRDLETIVLKALEKEASRRYASAEELAEDLSRFLSDRPIRARRVVLVEKLWRWCRRNPTVAALSSAVCVLMLGLTVAWGMVSWVKGDRDRARTAERLAIESRQLASRAEAVAKSRSHLALAIGYRYSIQPGRKAKCLQEIESALTFEPPEEIKSELRNQAIAALAQTDVKAGRKWHIWRDDTVGISFDSQLTRYARLDSAGVLSIREAEGDQEITHFVSNMSDVKSLQFSDQGEFLALIDNIDGGTIEVWNTNSGKKIIGPLTGCWAFDFDDSQAGLAVCQADLTLHVYSLANGEEQRKYPMKTLPIAIAYSDDGQQLATVLKGEPADVLIMDAVSGKVINTLKLEGSVQFCSWHPDGNRIACSCSAPNNLEIWDIGAGSKIATMVGHSQQVGIACFSKNGEFVTSGSWDGTLRVWETHTGNEVAVFTNGGAVHSGHAQVVAMRTEAGETSTVELDLPGGFTRYTNGNSTEISKYLCGEVSPDSRLLIAGTANGLEAWDLVQRKKLGSVSYPQSVALHINWLDKQFVTADRTQGIQHWPVEVRESTWRVRPPAIAGPERTVAQFACSTPDGARWAIVDSDGEVRILSTQGEIVRKFEAPVGQEMLCLSPNGKFLATYGWHVPTSNIWNVDTGELLHVLEGATTFQSFTPDSQQLITSRAADYTFRSLQDWRVVRRVERHECIFPSSVAYSPGGELVAMELSWGVLHLLRTDNFQSVALLDSPKRGRPTQFKFAGDGNKLYAFHHLTGEIHAWDIDQLRGQLTSLALDWENSSSSPGYLPTNKNDVAQTGPQRFEFVSAPSTDETASELALKRIVAAENSLAVEPESPNYVNQLAWLLVASPLEFRDPARAVALVEKLKQSSPLDVNSRNTLAVAYFRCQRFSDAVELLQSNVQQQEDAYLAFDLYILAMCYWQLGEYDRARDVFAWSERMYALLPPPDLQSRTELQTFRAEAQELMRAR